MPRQRIETTVVMLTDPQGKDIRLDIRHFLEDCTPAPDSCRYSVQFDIASLKGGSDIGIFGFGPTQSSALVNLNQELQKKGIFGFSHQLWNMAKELNTRA
ncbi:MAG: hypothetical protein WAZ18_00585 [Alphaproteobacteria bacterium]